MTENENYTWKEGRKEGRQSSKQAGRQAGRLLHYRANENETMCLSCLLAFTLLAHDETVLCSTLGTRVVVGTSSRRSSHPRVRFAHVNKYKGSLRPHMLKPTFQLSRSIVNFVFLCLLPLKPEGAAQVKPRELEPRFRFAR